MLCTINPTIATCQPEHKLHSTIAEYVSPAELCREEDIMPLRTRLLLSLMLIAVIPLTLFGLTAYQVSTSSLIGIERNSLEGALDSVDRALVDIRSNLVRYLRDYVNWDDIHAQAAKDAPDPEWVQTNLAPDNPTSTVNSLGLQLLGIWNSADKLVYTVGPVETIAPDLAEQLKNALAATEPYAALVSISPDVYIITLASIRTSQAKDPNGVLLFGRKLGADELNQIKALTGYEVALYSGLQQIATTQAGTLIPSPNKLQNAATGQQDFDQTDPNVALAYRPLLNDAGKPIATFVIWKSRSAVAAAQTSIAGTLTLWFALGALLAVIVAVLLGRSITRPLLAMAERADRMAAGDLSQPVVAPSSTNDELGRLANAFNQMASRIGERIGESEAENLRLQAIDEYRLKLLTAITKALYTPLDNIRSHSESLEMRLYGTLNEAQQRSVSAIHRAVSLADALLSDLVDFAQAQQKQLRIFRERVPLGEVVQAAAVEIQPHYDSKHIQFTSVLPDNLPPVLADRTRIYQILSNLLDFAFDLSIPGGRVELSAIEQGNDVRVSISDTSNGLSPDEQARLFELFYYPEKDGQHDKQARPFGNGLGLAFVKALVEQQSGKLTVDVQRDKGNTFTFTLPAMR
jgi:signal transduction histidine kinase